MDQCDTYQVAGPKACHRHVRKYKRQFFLLEARSLDKSVFFSFFQLNLASITE